MCRATVARLGSVFRAAYPTLPGVDPVSKNGFCDFPSLKMANEPHFALAAVHNRCFSAGGDAQNTVATRKTLIDHPG